MRGLMRRVARRVLPGTVRDGMNRARARLRMPGMVHWLQEQRPEIYRRLTAPGVPLQLRDALLLSLASDDYRRLPRWGTRPKTVETDVLVIAAQHSPDMVKDVIALRSQRPGLHCTLLFGDTGGDRRA